MIIFDYISSICNAITTRNRFDLSTSVHIATINVQAATVVHTIYYIFYINGFSILCAPRTINTQIVVAAALLFLLLLFLCLMNYAVPRRAAQLNKFRAAYLLGGKFTALRLLHFPFPTPSPFLPSPAPGTGTNHSQSCNPQTGKSKKHFSVNNVAGSLLIP